MIPVITRIASLAARPASRLLTKGKDLGQKFISRIKTAKKPTGTQKSSKEKIKDKKYQKPPKKRSFFGWLFGDDKKEIQEEIPKLEKSFQKSQQTKRPLKYEYEESKFFFKRKKFSEDKDIDESMNEGYKKTKERSHKISEIKKRISLLFNVYLEDRKQRLFDGRELKDYDSRLDNLFKNDKQKDKSNRFGFLGAFFRRNKIPNKKKPLKTRIKNYFDRKTKTFLKKHKNIRKILVKTKLSRRFVKQKVINPVKRPIVQTKNYITEKTQNIKNTVIKKVTDPFEIRTKTAKYLSDKKNEAKKYLNEKKESLKLKSKEFIQKQASKIKEIPDKILEHANKAQNSKVPNTSDLGELGKDLEDARLKELEVEKEFKSKELENLETEKKLKDAEQKLRDARKNASWYKKAQFWAEEKAIAGYRNSLKTFNWLSDKTARAKEVLKRGYDLTTSFTNKIIDAKNKAPKIINEFFSKIKKVGLKSLNIAKPLLKRIPLIGQVLITALTLFDLAQAKSNMEVRNIIGRGIGGIIGAIIGGLGMVAGPIVGFLTTMIMSFVGEWIGEQLSYFGIEPIDLIPFDKYNASIEEKIEILRETLQRTKIPGLFFNKTIFEEALRSGKYLDNPGETLEYHIHTATNRLVEDTLQKDVNEDGKIANYTGNNEQITKIKPIALNSTQQDVLKLLDEVGNMVGVDPLILKSIAASESGLKPTAQNPNATADGLFQMLNGTWNAMAKKYGRKYGIPEVSQRGGIKLDPRANAILGAHLIKENLAIASGYVSTLKPVDAYIPHFLGHGGAKIFYRGLKNNPDEIGYKGLASSPGDPVVKHNMIYWFDKKSGQWFSKAGTYQKMANTLESKIAAYGLSSGGISPITDADITTSSSTKEGEITKENTESFNTSYSVSGEVGDETVVKAANIARSRAHQRSTGYCARYVKTALNKAGFPYMSGHAFQLHTNGELRKLNFSEISTGTQGYSAQVGDVVVIDRFLNHKYGHVAIFDGKNWISDFIQRGINIYKNLTSDKLLHIYRYSGEFDKNIEDYSGAKNAKGSEIEPKNQKITKNITNKKKYILIPEDEA